jgi:hypothetical protein
MRLSAAPVLLAAVLSFLPGCGSPAVREPGLLTLWGRLDVLAAGTRSETVVIETAEGEVFALVGDLACELRASWGMSAWVTGIPTDEGWSIHPAMQRIWVEQYTLEGGTGPDEDPAGD